MTERNRKLALRAHRILRRITRCAYCGRKGTELADPDNECWQIDHVIPLAQGGEDSLANMTKSCAACNQDKSAERWQAMTRGIVTAGKVKATMDDRGWVAGMRRPAPIPKPSRVVEREAATADQRWRAREREWEREFQLKERRGL